MASSMKAAMVAFTGLGMLERFMPLLLLPFVTRAMSVTDYGSIGVLTASSALILAVLGGSMEQAVFRWSAKVGRKSAPMLRAARSWLMVIAPLLCLAGSGVLWVYPGTLLQVDTALWSIELIALSFSLTVSCYALPRLRALRALSRYVVVASTTIVIGLAGKLVFVIILGWGALGWVWSDVATGLAGFVMALIFVPRVPKSRVTAATVKRLANFSIPLIPHVASFWALYALTRPVLALFMPLSEVAIYSVAMSAASLGTVVLAEINRAVLPEYSRASFPIPFGRLLQAMRIQLIAPFILSQIVVFASPLFVSLVLPPKYVDAAAVLSVLSLISVGYGIYLVYIDVVVQTAGVTTWSWFASVSGAGVILAGCLLVAPAGNLIAIAIVNVIGFAAMALVAFALVKVMKLPVLWRASGLASPILFVFVACAIAAAACGASDLAPWVSMSVACFGILVSAGLGWRFVNSRGTKFGHETRLKQAA